MHKYILVYTVDAQKASMCTLIQKTSKAVRFDVVENNIINIIS